MPHPPPQVGGTIISPAAKLVKPAPMAIVVAKVPAVTKAKAVIDVVDLSDEEDGSKRAAVPVPAPGPRLARPLLARAPLQAKPRFGPRVGAGGGVRLLRPRQPGPSPRPRALARAVHPAPLPGIPNPQPNNAGWKMIPPRPTLKASFTCHAMQSEKWEASLCVESAFEMNDWICELLFRFRGRGTASCLVGTSGTR